MIHGVCVGIFSATALGVRVGVPSPHPAATIAKSDTSPSIVVLFTKCKSKSLSSRVQSPLPGNPKLALTSFVLGGVDGTSPLALRAKSANPPHDPLNMPLTLVTACPLEISQGILQRGLRLGIKVLGVGDFASDVRMTRLHVSDKGSLERPHLFDRHIV